MSEAAMFFSIIIPVYNVKPYLVPCVESVLNQTERDFEIILVDDESTDGSSQICDDLAQEAPDFIRVVHKENSGSLFTRRVGMQNAKGSYWLIVDADDMLISETALGSIKKTIEETGCDMVFYNATRDTSAKSPMFHYPFINKQSFCGDDKRQIYNLILRGQSFNALWNKAFHCSLADLQDDYSSYSNISNGTDFFQMLPLVTNAKKIVYLNEVLYFYRTTPESIIRKFRATIYDSMRGWRQRLHQHLTLWQMESEAEQLLYCHYLKSIATAAYKVRLCSPEEKRTIALPYLERIANDDSFRTDYVNANRSKLPVGRRLIVELLYRRKCKLLLKLISLQSRFLC